MGASKTLRVAIDLKDLGLCKQIVQEGVEINAGYKDCNGCTALLYSMQKDRPAIAEYLVLSQAAPTGRTCSNFKAHGMTVFHYAAFRNYSKLLKVLLERHRDVYFELAEPLHPLHFAVGERAEACVIILLDYDRRSTFWKRSRQLDKGLPDSQIRNSFPLQQTQSSREQTSDWQMCEWVIGVTIITIRPPGIWKALGLL